MIKNPVAAGALFDFLGWASAQTEVFKLGAGEPVYPAVRALERWAILRGLDLNDAGVNGWNGADLNDSN